MKNPAPHFWNNKSVSLKQNKMRFAAGMITVALFFFADNVRGQQLGDWQLCSTSSQCQNGCCSSKYSNGVLKCTPLTGGFNAAICVSPDQTGSLGDWQFCSTSSQCQNGCCSSAYSNDGKLKCTPLNGGFDPAICVANIGGSVLYSGSGSGTFYYDVTGRTCSGGAPYKENNGYPYCTSFVAGSDQKTVEQYGTNNIVAIDANFLSQNRDSLCGKQIHVYKDGVEVSGGPFVVFDGCEACVGGGRIDFSLSALDSIDNGNACNDGVVPGITWRVTDNQIIPFVP